MDIVHKHAQLVLSTETNWQPVQLNQTWRNVVSRVTTVMLGLFVT